MRLATTFLLAAALGAAGPVSADAIASLSYDEKTDELVVTILYSGTNPDHDFTLQWSPCIHHPDGTNDASAEVIDSQDRDAVSQEFKKTQRFSLKGLSCRPATVTLHAAPRSYLAVPVPAAP